MEQAQQEVVEKALSVPEQAESIIITDDTTYEQAGEVLITIKALRKEINGVFDPIVKAAHAAHKEAVNQKKKAEEPLVKAEGILKPRIARYMREQEEKRIAAEREAREKARKEEEERRLAEALKAEESGNKEEAEAILNEEPAPAPVVHQATTPKLNGVAVKKLWKFRIVDINQIPRQYMVPDETAIGQVVRGLKDKTSIPGIEVYSEDSVAAGSR